MPTRTTDGAKGNVPRELIHFLRELKDVQVKKLELGVDERELGKLFARSAFKEALQSVSNTYLHQTIYAEYPYCREWLEALRGQKSEQSLPSFGRIWGVAEDEAGRRAEELAKIGIWVPSGPRESRRFWTHFIFRGALELVQGGV